MKTSLLLFPSSKILLGRLLLTISFICSIMLTGCSDRDFERVQTVISLISMVSSQKGPERLPYERCNHRTRPCCHTFRGPEEYRLEYVYPTDKVDILKLEAKLLEIRLAIAKEQARREQLKR